MVEEGLISQAARLMLWQTQVSQMEWMCSQVATMRSVYTGSSCMLEELLVLSSQSSLEGNSFFRTYKLCPWWKVTKYMSQVLSAWVQFWATYILLEYLIVIPLQTPHLSIKCVLWLHNICMRDIVSSFRVRFCIKNNDWHWSRWSKGHKGLAICRHCSAEFLHISLLSRSVMRHV